MVNINTISKVLYALARGSRDAQAVTRSVQTGSVAPLLARFGRKFVLREVNKLANKSMKDL